MEEENEYNNLDIDGVHDLFDDDDKKMQQYFNELLFCIQNVGSYKMVSGIRVFVKDQY
jgi:hypothetical protein